MGLARRRACYGRFRLSIAAGGLALTAGDNVFRLRDVDKTYEAAGTRFRLTIPELDIERGARFAFIGESGSGKSTLLELLAMILGPSKSGMFEFTPDPHGDASDIAALWRGRQSDALSALRSRNVGYVLQHGGLLPYLSVRHNIELPRRLLGLSPANATQAIARELGIAAQLDKRPAMLSVGQRQRAAIARALIHDPPIVIADEPTAALDPMQSEHILALLTALAEQRGVTLIVATHEQDRVRRAGFQLLAHAIVSADDRGMTVCVGNGTRQ